MLTLSACGSSGETIAMVPAPTDSAVNTITVNSSEKVNVVPDIAEVVYSVQTESPDAAGCQQQNTEDVNKVVELLNDIDSLKKDHIYTQQEKDTRMTQLKADLEKLGKRR